MSEVRKQIRRMPMVFWKGRVAAAARFRQWGGPIFGDEGSDFFVLKGEEELLLGFLLMYMGGSFINF